MRPVAEPGDAHTVGAADPLPDRQRVGMCLTGVLFVGECVDDRNRRRVRPLVELRLEERADRDRIEVAREHARRIGERLAAGQLQLVRQQRHGRAAELGDRDGERDAGSGRRLLEEKAERPPGQARLVWIELQLGREVEDGFGLGRDEVGDTQDVSSGK